MTDNSPRTPIVVYIQVSQDKKLADCLPFYSEIDMEVTYRSHDDPAARYDVDFKLHFTHQVRADLVKNSQIVILDCKSGNLEGTKHKFLDEDCTMMAIPTNAEGYVDWHKTIAHNVFKRLIEEHFGI